MMKNINQKNHFPHSFNGLICKNNFVFKIIICILSALAILSAILVGCFWQTLNAEEQTEIVSPSLFHPNEYFNFYDPIDISIGKTEVIDINNKFTYILDGKNNNSRLLIFEEGKLQPKIIDGNTSFANAKKVSVSQNVCVIVNISNENCSLISFSLSEQSPTFKSISVDNSIKDIEFVGSDLFVLFSKKLVKYSVSSDATITKSDEALSTTENANFLSSFFEKQESQTIPKIIYFDNGTTPHTTGFFEFNTKTNTATQIVGNINFLPNSLSATTKGFFVSDFEQLYYFSFQTKLQTVVCSLQNTQIQQNTLQPINASYVAKTTNASNDLFFFSTLCNTSKTFQSFEIVETANSATLKYVNGSFKSSYGINAGKFSQPKNTYEYNGILYVADFDNSRIQKISSLRIETIKTMKKPENVVFSTQGKLYYSNSNSLVCIEKENETTLTTSQQIEQLCIDLKGDLYYSSANKIFKIANGKETEVFSVEKNITAFSISQNYDHFYVAVENKFEIWNIQNKTKILTTIINSNIKDIKLDFLDNIFILDENSNISYYTIANNKSQSTLNKKIALSNVISFGEQTIEISSPNSICLSQMSGAIVLTYANEHLLATLQPDTISFAKPSDIPKIEIPVNSLDKLNQNDFARVGIVGGYPSTCIYPVHKDFENDEKYPTGLNKTSYEILQDNSTVLIVGETGKYYYIFHNNQFGFILKNTVYFPQSVALSFSDAVIMHREATIYKYPSTLNIKETNSKNYLFAVETLAKDTRITLLDKVADYRDSNDILWYKIKYGNNNKIGFIPRANVSKYIASISNNKPTETAKIQAPTGKGVVDIFDSTNEDSIALSQIKDGEIVTILDKSIEGWFYVESTDINGQTIAGYIKASFTTTNGLTSSQIVGVCAIITSIILILGGIILCFFLWHKNKTRKKVIINFAENDGQENK